MKQLFNLIWKMHALQLCLFNSESLDEIDFVLLPLCLVQLHNWLTFKWLGNFKKGEMWSVRIMSSQTLLRPWDEILEHDIKHTTSFPFNFCCCFRKFFLRLKIIGYYRHSYGLFLRPNFSNIYAEEITRTCFLKSISHKKMEKGKYSHDQIVRVKQQRWRIWTKE